MACFRTRSRGFRLPGPGAGIGNDPFSSAFKRGSESGHFRQNCILTPQNSGQHLLLGGSSQSSNRTEPRASSACPPPGLDPRPLCPPSLPCLPRSCRLSRSFRMTRRGSAHLAGGHFLCKAALLSFLNISTSKLTVGTQGKDRLLVIMDIRVVILIFALPNPSVYLRPRSLRCHRPSTR